MQTYHFVGFAGSVSVVGVVGVVVGFIGFCCHVMIYRFPICINVGWCKIHSTCAFGSAVRVCVWRRLVHIYALSFSWPMPKRRASQQPMTAVAVGLLFGASSSSPYSALHTMTSKRRPCGAILLNSSNTGDFALYFIKHVA